MKMLLAVMIAAVSALTAPVGTRARLVDVERSGTVAIVGVATPTQQASVGFAAVAPTVDEAPSATTSVVTKAEETTTTIVTETSTTTTSVASDTTAPTTVADTSATTTPAGPGPDHCPASGSIPATGEPSTTTPVNADGRC